MIVLDRIVTSPGRGLMWVFRSIHKAVQEQGEHEVTDTRARLSDLYTQLEHGEITEEEFDDLEKELLDRLEELEGAQAK